jgi:hypothetical protein
LDSITLTASVLQIGCNNNDVSAVEALESSVIIEARAVAKVGVKLLFKLKKHKLLMKPSVC